MRLGQVLGHASRTKERIAWFLPQDPIRRTCSWAAGQGEKAWHREPKGDIVRCEMVLGETSPMRDITHTHTRIYAQTHTSTHSFSHPHRRPHTYVCGTGGRWLKKPAKQGGRCGSPGRLCNWSPPGLRASVETAAENSKIAVSGCQAVNQGI